jgi:hypothetical protein
LTDRPVAEPAYEPQTEQPWHHPERQDAPDGGWPGGLPYTVYFPDGDGLRGADLEHDAPLPRVGDTVEYVDEAGNEHRYRVTEVIHTLQTSAHDRPSVSEGSASPQSLAHPGEPPEPPGGNGTVRAGLPKVILAPISDD